MSEDLIKRSDAIEALEQEKSDWNNDYNVIDNCIESLNKVKSADIPHSDDWERYSDKLWKNAYERGKADRPQGEWIEVDDASISCRCSVCGWEAHLYEDDVYGMPYCPNCGARMKGADDD